MRTATGSTADAIKQLALNHRDRDVPVQNIVDELQDRGFGIIMILFALPNAVIPGLSLILGAPVLVAGMQLALGRNSVWLPGFMRRRIIPDRLFQRIVARVVRFLTWVERRTQRRWLWVVSGFRQRAIGFYIAIVAAFLMLPVPFGNLLPAIGISLMAVGLNEEDGKAAAIGALIGLLGAIYIATVIAVGVKALEALIGFL